MEKINRSIRALSCLLAVLLMLCPIVRTSAQNARGVSGRVVDDNNEPIVGATVLVKNTGLGTATDIDGRYMIKASDDATISFSFLGYVSKEEKVGSRTEINVMMVADQTQIEDVVVVGYGVQKRGSVTGSVASVKGDDMLQTKNENPQNMLTGRVSGVRVWQKSAEPGSYKSDFDVRGMGSPLVIIDGVPRDLSDFQRMNPGDIEDISVLKDAAAAIYGLRAANGVLLITTKKGAQGRVNVSYNGSYTFQVPASMPKLADPYETMTLYNEQAKNNVNGGAPVYTEAMFEEFRNGTRRTTDWNKLVFADYAPQTQHDVSIAGGTEKTQYFVSLGYFYQEGFFRSGDLNYDKYNIRSNISTQIVRGLTFDINLSGMADQQNNPYSTSADIIRNYWRQGVLFPAYADEAGTMLNYEGLDLEENTVAKMTSDISGYRKYRQKQFQSSASLNFDFGTLHDALEGLSAKGMLSFDYRFNDNEIFRKEYYQYAFVNGEYVQKLYAPSSPNNLRREHYNHQQTLGQILLTYNRTFARHRVGAMIGWEAQKRKGDNFYALRNLAFGSPYLFNGVEEGQMGASNPNDVYESAYGSLIGRVNYAFDDRYLIEAQFRYDGSSQFAKGHRWGFFPSVSVGWRISEEPFFKASGAGFVNQLKLRASYGEMGDDSGAGYDWIAGYTYPATSSNSEKGYYAQWAPGYLIGGEFVTAANPKALPNTAISWFTAKTFNVGVDFEAWNGMLGLSVEYYSRKMTGLYEYATSVFPTVIGSTPPRENVNSSKNMGLEVEISHRNRVGEFAYGIKGIASITRKKWLRAVQNGPYANSYDRWRHDNLNNRYQGVQFGYESAGRYESWEDIWNYPIYKGRDVLPGDYKYLDWNGDGEINGLDEHPFAFDSTPWLNYSLGFDFSWRNLDASVLFQGSALGSMQYVEPLYSIWGANGGGALEQFLDRWHPTDPSADPYDPATEWEEGYYAYTGHSPKGNSQFNRVSTAYLRLKSIEVGYTLPRIRQVPDLKMRVYANAYNLFTFTGVKFVDPEHPEDDLGRLYPLNRTFTLGLSLSF